MDNQPSAPAAPAELAHVPVLPATWPGAFGLFKHCKQVVKANVWPILGLSVISVLLGGVSRQESDSAAMMVAGLVAALLSLWVSLALIMMFKAGIHSEKLSFMESFKQSAPYYLRSFGILLLSCLILFVSLIALIIPFLFVLPRIALANYFLIDRNVGVVEAIKLSWRETKGHSLKVWGIIGVTILFALLCLVLVGIYLLFFYQAAYAILYYVLKKSQPATDAVPEAAPAPIDATAAPLAASDASATPAPVENSAVADSTAPQQPNNPSDQNPTPPAV